jgi:hypothetical protein
MRGVPGIPDERDALVERLREFIRVGYVTGSEVARRIGAHSVSVQLPTLWTSP